MMGSMLDICIRPAQLSDRDQLLRMRVALWPDASPEDLAKELTLILDGKAPVTLPHIILVAEILVAEVLVVQASHPMLAGFLEVDLRSHADGCDPSRPTGYIEGWYIAEDLRHAG